MDMTLKKSAILISIISCAFLLLPFFFERQLSIVAQSNLIGDANNDCVVNISDFVIWINHYAQNTSTSQSVGDFDASGKVNVFDSVLWLIHNGQRCASPNPSASVAPSSSSNPSGTGITYENVKAWAEAYKAAHPGNGGKDWDINNKTPAEIAADPDLQRLVSICGQNQRPVIPIIAWEYGGVDHPWINPDASALVYCVYIPVSTPTVHWQYDQAQDRVTADVYVLFPDRNPCKDQIGKDQVIACLGDPTNSEILVDTASLNDGVYAGLPTLMNASTLLYLILPDGTKVQLLLNI
jgi:hypothetical protein